MNFWRSRLPITLSFGLWLGLISNLAQAQQQELKIEVDGKEMYYLLHTPSEYSSSNDSFPLLIFLHGYGERGNDYELLKVHGPPKNVDQGSLQEYPFIVLSPQLPLAWERWQVDHLNKLLTSIRKSFRIDDKRIYLTGLSMGGHGTWNWSMQNPELFAAIAPICGWFEDPNPEAIKDIPTWVFHGARDEVIPITASQSIVDRLDEIYGDVRFTVYPTLGHLSWDEAYDTGILYKWFSTIRKE